MRINYKKSSIDFKNLTDSPIEFFLTWFDEALKVNKDEANACILSTISAQNTPTSRVVLLKSIHEKGFIFFTNYKSNKSTDIENNNNVALNFYWPEVEKQVRITGKAFKISTKESDSYFKSRPRESQMGAWLSHQSTAIGLNYNFMDTLKNLESKFKGKEVERPLHWGGYSVEANSIEFWQGRPSRLHDRLLYELNGTIWNKKRLAP